MHIIAIRRGLCAIVLVLMGVPTGAAWKMGLASSFMPAAEHLKSALALSELTLIPASSGQWLLRLALATTADGSPPVDLLLLAHSAPAPVAPPALAGYPQLPMASAGLGVWHAPAATGGARIGLPAPQTAPVGRVAARWLAAQPSADLQPVYARSAAAVVKLAYLGAVSTAVTAMPVWVRARAAGIISATHVRAVPPLPHGAGQVHYYLYVLRPAAQPVAARLLQGTIAQASALHALGYALPTTH